MSVNSIYNVGINCMWSEGGWFKEGKVCIRVKADDETGAKKEAENFLFDKFMEKNITGNILINIADCEVME